MTYKALGLMSGTSLDGLDIAFCTFINEDGRWSYAIHHAETVPYTPEWKALLSTLESRSAFEYVGADSGFGHLSGMLARNFIEKHHIAPDFIASHGHTIFHQPDQKITSQIGRGSAIAAETGVPVICDFRSLDVALGGQGAPLVPAGDAVLFGQYSHCLNIGGFANISQDIDGKRIAYDVCPANIVLNQLASKAGLEYDRDGNLAGTGKPDPDLLDTLNQIPYYQQPYPKSLGKEWVVKHVSPLLIQSKLIVNNQLATFCEHIAIQIGKAAGNQPGSKLLITGGGAFNSYLIERIRLHTSPEIVIPDPLTINFKEALIFAFLGVMRWRGEINTLQSVTGAEHDSPGGAIYLY